MVGVGQQSYQMSFNRIRCHSYQMSFEKKGQVQTPCLLAELGGVGQEILQAHV
jgi:hypothetical protein